MKQKAILVLVYLLVASILGYVISQQLSGFLGISITPRSFLEAEIPEVRPPAEGLTAMPSFQAIILPERMLGDERYERAAGELVKAIEYRTGEHPLVLETAGAPPAGATVTVDNRALGIPAVEGAFALRGQEQKGSIKIEAADSIGGVYGMYYLAAQLKAGVKDIALSDLNQVVTPALDFRLVDMGGVGVVPDEQAWREHDYSHHLRAFQDVLLAQSPYIDDKAMADVMEDFQEYIHRMIAFGYNGIVIDGFLEYVDFDKVGNGYEVYEDGSDYRERHAALRKAFGEMLNYANEMGLKVILKTDMLVLSDPLASYFQENLGGIDTVDPALWQVYRQGLAELFEAFPFIDGLMIRIGEAGSIYNLEGWDYYSSLDVRTVTAVKLMLEEFTDVASDYDQTIFFRSWSVGIGEVGDMHTNPEAYERLLGDINAPNLVISTKYTMGDYYSYLPLNPTLTIGDQRRIVEFQARREFEAFNAFPNYMGPTHQAAIQELIQANPNIEGVWVWTQSGGPQRAGPWSIYPFNGFWQTYDDNIYATAQLAWDPDQDIQDLTEAWIRLTLSDDPRTVNNLVQALLLSREATLKGLYIGEFASKQVLAMGLEPPPQFWVFEWDIVSGSNSALSAIYTPVAGNVDAAIVEGFEAVEIVRQMQALIEESDQSSFYEPDIRDKLVESLAYEEDLFETLAWYRMAFLLYYQWLDEGDTQVYDEWQSALTNFNSMKEQHLERYGENLDFPAYNFFAVKAGLAHAERSVTMMWAGRVLLTLMVLTLLAGTGPIQRLLPGYAGKTGFRSMWLALTNPWNLGAISVKSRLDILAVSVWPLLLVLAGRLVFSSFLSPAYIILAAILIGPFIFVLLTINRGFSNHHMWGAIGGALIATIIPPLAMVAVRGPVTYWYQFWMGPDVRTLYVTLVVILSAWLLLILYVTQRTAYQAPRATVIGNIMLAFAASFIMLGSTISMVGLEVAITTINDQMAILPLGLSRILGITTHLDIPLSLPRYIMLLGLTLAIIGLLLTQLRRLFQAGNSGH